MMLKRKDVKLYFAGTGIHSPHRDAKLPNLLALEELGSKVCNNCFLVVKRPG